MKSFPGSQALVALAAAMLLGSGPASAAADAPPKADTPCAGCPQAAADNPGAPPMMDRMKDHVDGMKSALAALRESEKALAAAGDPKAFRTAVIEHLRKLDDLQASHLVHMESMMGRKPGGKPGMDRGSCAGCRCGDCGCRECRGGDCRHDDCCRCGGGGPPAGGHSH